MCLLWVIFHMGINILSLFDGISSGYLALQRAGIEVDNYYASEIDKYAISISKYNFPNIKHLGDIRNWKDWDIDWNSIDLLIGGSSCKSLSIASAHKWGRQSGLDVGESTLFWKYVEILEHLQTVNLNTKFLLENVYSMKKQDKVKITEVLHTVPVLINSSLVSAQQRKRYYWTNINQGSISQPEDKGILLKDVIDSGAVDRDKSLAIDASYYKGASWNHYKKKSVRQLVIKDPIKLEYISKNFSGNRVYSIKGKSRTLMANGGGWGAKTGLYVEKEIVRKLHPIECERLQTLPDNYTQYGINDKGDQIEISNTQRYKTIGNGWTIDVLAHIFSHLDKEK